MAYFSIKRGDTLPKLRYSIRPITTDLTGAVVLARMRPRRGAPVALAGTTTIITATGSPTVEYAWDAADTAAAGRFEFEFEVTFPGGAVQTFPGTDYIQVVIGADTDGGVDAPPSAVTQAILKLGAFEADPSPTADGWMWYNNTLDKFRMQEGGAAVDVRATAPSVDVQTFTTVGAFTWTKPIGATMLLVQLHAGGGAGAGGRCRTDSTTGASGGAGGGAGGYMEWLIPATDFGATVSVTVGAGGTGGLGRATALNGGDGTIGGDSLFGVLRARGGLFGGGGSATTAVAGIAGCAIGELSGNNTSYVANGAAGGLGGGAAGFRGGKRGGGGGGGAGFAAASTTQNSGGDGGIGAAFLIAGLSLNGFGGLGGVGAGSNGASGAAPFAGMIGGDGGGGGANGGTTANGGAGADGLSCGGGGGGGGAATLPFASGKGGDGAPGSVRVTVYF